jgi:predicted DNA binding CopG/RHH family protein
MKKEKVYKALWVTEKLANDIKSRASKKGLTTIQFLQETFKRTSK